MHEHTGGDYFCIHSNCNTDGVGNRVNAMCGAHRI